MEEQFRTVARSDCYESPLNNRRHFDEAALKDLAASIASKGILTPLLVRQNANGDGRYEILAGARRFRAATAAELPELPVVVRRFTDDEALEVVVIENLQRQDVAPLEEAEGYRALLDRPGYDVAGIAAKIGKSEAYVYQRLKLCELIEPAKKALREDKITPGHALLLARLQPQDQKQALKNCFEDRWSPSGTIRLTLPVRALSSWIHSNLQLELKSAPFDTNDGQLVPGAGTCAACPKRSGFAPALFPDITGKDVCTDRTCFREKVAAHLAREKERLASGGEDVVEISTRHGTEEKGQPLPPHRWTEIKRGQKKCDSARTALVTAGDRDLAKVLTVCTDQSCGEHGHSGHSGGMYSTTASPAEKARRAKEQEKQRQAAELRRRIFLAVHAAAPNTLSRAEHDDLLAGYLEEMQQDSIRALVQALGIDPVKRKRYGGDATYAAWEDTAKKWAKSLDDDGVVRALIILPLVPGLEGRDWISDRRKGMLRKAALYGVDVKAIEKAIDAEAKERAAKKAKRANKAAGKAKKAAPAKAKKKA